MAKTFDYTNGFSGSAAKVTTAVDITLGEADRKPVLCVTASAASKSVILGLGDGETMILINNGGTNAFTAKNLSGDSGTSIGTGKVALIIGSTTANGTLAYVLN